MDAYPSAKAAPAPDRIRSASVVVLVKNGGRLLRAALEAVQRQRIGVPIELVVLDSGSNDGSVEYARAIGARVATIPAAEFVFGRARDLAFKLTSGDAIVTISQDAVPIGDRWLFQFVQALEGGLDVAQGGEAKTGEAFFWDREGKFFFTRETERWLDRYGIGLSCVNVAFRRTAWQSCRFGDAPCCEDKVIQRRLASQGFRIGRCTAGVLHAHSYTLKTVWQRCFLEGKGWRAAGVSYGRLDAVLDTLRLRIWARLLRGIAEGDIRSAGEIMFPLVRPAALYLGNRGDA